MSDLLELIYRDEDDLVDAVRAALDGGADPNAITEYGESPLRVASNNGRFEVVELLLDAGADESQLGWSSLHRAVGLGGDDALAAALTDGADLSARDYWERTPYLLALQIGSVEMAARLIAAGADRDVRGRGGETPLAYAICGDHVEVVRWLLERGEDMEVANDWGSTALHSAVLSGARRCLDALLDAGADLSATNEIEERAIELTDDPSIIRALIAAGEELNRLGPEARALLTRLAASEITEVSADEYLRARYPRFGTANPERVDEPLWQMLIRTRESAWSARKRFEPDPTPRGAVWSFERFGTSITALGDGRFVEIAGEHEDHYDPDFHIYNDVFVHDGRGGCAIYLYPREVFPPTDFHSATLVGETIWIIGNLGYPPDRRPGETPVYALDIRTMAIRAESTGGEQPGWISGHRADLVGDTIVVRGGKRIGDEQAYVDNHEAYALSLDSLTWTRLASA